MTGPDPDTAASDYCVITETEYDGFGRAWKTTDDAASNLPASVDATVVKIGRAYDADGRLETVTSYNSTPSAVNGVKYTYNTWGMVTESMQDHASTAGSGTTRVRTS